MNQLSRNEDKQIEKHESKAVNIGNDEISGTRTLFNFETERNNSNHTNFNLISKGQFHEFRMLL